MPKPHHKAEVFDRLTRLEVLRASLEKDYEQAPHKNALVLDCLERAHKELNRAVRELTGGKDSQESLRIANIAWLLINFGRKLLDAETIETLLGDGVFLDLSQEVEGAVPIEGKGEGYADQLKVQFALLEKLVSDLSKAIIKKRA